MTRVITCLVDVSTTPKKTLSTGRPSTSVHVFANFEPGKYNISSDRWDMLKVVIVDNVMNVAQCKARNVSSVLKLVHEVENRTAIAAQRRMTTREASKLILDIYDSWTFFRICLKLSGRPSIRHHTQPFPTPPF
jgi:hypothetical protein